MLLLDPFILKHTNKGAEKVDLFVDNLFKIKKVQLLKCLESVVYNVKLRRKQKDRMLAFEN